MWFPNREKYKTIEEAEANFKYKTLKISVKESIEKEMRKLDLAKKSGFEVLVLWEEDGIELNMKKAKNFLNLPT